LCVLFSVIGQSILPNSILPILPRAVKTYMCIALQIYMPINKSLLTLAMTTQLLYLITQFQQEH
jgi:hypothetical protein